MADSARFAQAKPITCMRCRMCSWRFGMRYGLFSMFAATYLFGSSSRGSEMFDFGLKCVGPGSPVLAGLSATLGLRMIFRRACSIPNPEDSE